MIGKVILILFFIVFNIIARTFFILSPIISARLDRSGKIIIRTGIAPNPNAKNTEIEGEPVPHILGWFYIAGANLWNIARPFIVITAAFIDFALIIWFLQSFH